MVGAVRFHQLRRYALPLLLALAALAVGLLAGPAAAQGTQDYDDDDDGLIDIRTAPQLNAVSWDLNGNGMRDAVSPTNWLNFYTNVFVSGFSDMGCPAAGCTGYELRADIDMSIYATWGGIGSSATPYTAAFEGNGHTISNFTISGGTGDDVGLFGGLGLTGAISRVGIVGASVNAAGAGDQEVGILVGENQGVIRMSYTTGRISYSGSGSASKLGGLVGYNRSDGSVIGSYSTASVTGPTSGSTHSAGGLVGLNGAAGIGESGFIHSSYATGAVTLNADSSVAGGLAGHSRQGEIANSYALGAVSSTGAGSTTGGLVGTAHADATSELSYYDSGTTGQTASAQGTAKDTRELQSPTGYSGIYEDWWDVDVDGVAGDDSPWDFGTARHYPALKIDFNRDGRATCREFGPQRCYTPPGPPPYNWRADHPEIYANARHNITASCTVRTTGTGDAAVTTSTLTFNLADYTRPITLALSLWDRTHFRSLQSLGLNMPTLQRNGQTATAEVVTDPARTRFRLDGQYGLNLVLGYADCHTDDPQE